MSTLSLSVSELMLEKIRLARLELDRLLEVGVASEQIEMSDEDWRALEARAIARLDAKSVR